MRNKNIVKMAQIAMLMALVVVLQTVGTFVKVGAFNLSLVLIPIVIGGYLFGAKTGALLGGAFGVMALIYSISGNDVGGFMMWQANWWLTAIVCLVKGIAEHGYELDLYIEKYAKGWKFERIPLVAAAVMRLAMYEILYMPDIPNGASINEAVEIARKYENEDVVKFINGILGTFVRTEVLVEEPAVKPSQQDQE